MSGTDRAPAYSALSGPSNLIISAVQRLRDAQQQRREALDALLAADRATAAGLAVDLGDVDPAFELGGELCPYWRSQRRKAGQDGRGANALQCEHHGA